MKEKWEGGEEQEQEEKEEGDEVLLLMNVVTIPVSLEVVVMRTIRLKSRILSYKISPDVILCGWLG